MGNAAGHAAQSASLDIISGFVDTQQMADLQQVIIGLGVVPVLAEDVLQVQAAVFLNVEAFVFDFLP